MHPELEVTVVFAGEVSIALCYEGPPMTLPALTEQRQELMVRASRGQLTYVLPMMIKESGYTPTVDLVLNGDHVAVTTALPYASLVEQASELRIKLNMGNPRAYDDYYYWDCSVHLKDPVIHYLNIHKVMLMKLTERLAAPLLEYTVPDSPPTAYKIAVLLEDFQLLWCVNKHNLFCSYPSDKTSSASEKESTSHVGSSADMPRQNNYLVMAGSTLTVDFGLDYEVRWFDVDVYVAQSVCV